jgi:hypothetical protein
MIRAKIYYLRESGEVILHIPENHSQWATPTTRKHDETIYSPLQAYNPQDVDVLELTEGQYASDFISATNFRVNTDTLELEFNYPIYHPSLTETVNLLKIQNQNLLLENEQLKSLMADLASLVLEG